MIQIRPVRETDTKPILNIYKPYILNTAITFEEEVPSLEEFQKRIQTIAAEYPYLVCEWDGAVAGYAYAHRQMERASYRWNAELSVYFKQSCLHHGLGRMLYSALLEILRLQGIQNAYACVTVPNRNSERLHEAMGFQRIGVYRQTGYKCGSWRDVVWFGKSIGGHEIDPSPFIPFRELDGAVWKRILNSYSGDSKKVFF